MTYIQPNKNKSILNTMIVLLLVVLGTSVVGMIALYNATVNLSHNIDVAKAQLDSVGAASTKLQNQVIATLSDGAVNTAAGQDGLIIESKPQYFPVHDPWALASHS